MIYCKSIFHNLYGLTGNWFTSISELKCSKWILKIPERLSFEGMHNINRVVVVITTAQLHSTKSEIRFCTRSNPVHGVSEIRNGENLWQWSPLEIRLNVFRRPTVPQNHHHHLYHETFKHLEAATGSVLKKKVLLKFRKIHKKTPVPESLF